MSAVVPEVDTDHLFGVSVVIPTYNRRAQVRLAVESALAQSRPADEIIVVDDGSTDGTAMWLRDHFGEEIKLIIQDNLGVAAARNTGIASARFELVAFLDSDDVWTPEKLAVQVPAMADPRVVLSATNWRWENESRLGGFVSRGRSALPKIRLESDPIKLLCNRKGHGINIPTCICRRSALQRLGGFDTSLRISEDMDLIFRLADLGAFALASQVLMVRGAEGGASNLTRYTSFEWRQENLDNTIGILKRCIERPVRRTPESRYALRVRLTQLLSYRAKMHARSGEYVAARRLCSEGASLSPMTKDALYCRIGAQFPHILRLLRV